MERAAVSRDETHIMESSRTPGGTGRGTAWGAILAGAIAAAALSLILLALGSGLGLIGDLP